MELETNTTGHLSLRALASLDAVNDLSNELVDNVKELKQKDDELTTVTETMRKKISTLETDVRILTEKNFRLKNAIDALLALEVCVPYEEGYLRAIGVTRTMRLYDWWQQNVNKI